MASLSQDLTSDQEKLPKKPFTREKREETEEDPSAWLNILKYQMKTKQVKTKSKMLINKEYTSAPIC